MISPSRSQSTKFVFVTGGVVSSIGKGIVAASLGRLLKSRSYSVSILKLDPYLNVDPGTMSPYQHGEVFVTRDGAETDGVPAALDMVRLLVEGHEAVARTARGVFPAVDEGEDEASADLLTQRLQIHEKTAWMLRSLLK